MANQTSDLDLDLEALCRRAIDDPASITRAEHNKIKDRPPPEEEDRLCVAKTGSTLAELVAKALANPDDLTLTEVQIIYHPAGVCFEERQREHERERDAAAAAEERTTRGQAQVEIQPTNASSPPLRALRDEAARVLRAASGEDAKMALLNAVDRLEALEDAQLAESQRHFDEWNARQRLEHGTFWIKHILSNGLFENGADCWGFVVFRTGGYGGVDHGGAEEAWPRFRKYFDKAAEATVLHWNSGPLLWPKFRCVFVERQDLDGASNEELREMFRRMRDGDGEGSELPRLPKGIRTSCFLVADQNAIESDAVKTGFIMRDDFSNPPFVTTVIDDPVMYIRAVDPDYTAYDESSRAEVDKEEGIQSGNTGSSDRVELEVMKGPKMAGFNGEVTVALPRVFDWLHDVCFHMECGTNWQGQPLDNGWSHIYEQTRVPEAWVRVLAPNSGDVSYTYRDRKD